MNSRVRPAIIHPAVFRSSGAALSIRAERKKTEDCIVCGADLIYRKETTEEICLICGHSFPTHAICTRGHYVCDACHSKDILERVESMLAGSQDCDPVHLALRIFEIPGLNMHGPEYHSIVPAILVAAWQNSNNNLTVSAVHEAIERGKSIKGGSCGLHGNCGAGVGAGIAVSVIEEATPLSTVSRGAANRATALSLLAISEHGGPRCCKRDAITSIESFMASTPYFHEPHHTAYVCRQYAKNKSCMGKICPYHPINQTK